MITKAEPRFNLDLPYGKEGERQIETFLGWVASQDWRVEVKRKRYLDHHVYIETACDKGRTGVYVPSGINVTTAEVWAIVIGDTGIHLAIPTGLLRAMLSDPTTRDREETDGDYPTRGRLVDFVTLLYRLKQQRLVPVPAPAVVAELAEERRAIAVDGELTDDQINWSIGGRARRPGG